MLVVLFQLNSNDFGVDAMSVHKVIPLVSLDETFKAHTIDGMVGSLEYEGNKIPIFDLGKAIYDKPVKHKLSSRILIVENEQHFIGFLAEHATETININAKMVQKLKVNYKDYEYLHSNIIHKNGNQIQLIDIEKLIKVITKHTPLHSNSPSLKRFP